MKRQVGLILFHLILALSSLEAQAQEYTIPLDRILTVSWHPDGTKIAVGGGSVHCGEVPQMYQIYILDALTGEVLNKFEGHSCQVDTIAWSPDGTKLASGSTDSTAIIWDADTGEIISRIQHFNSRDSRVGQTWSPDGSKIADFFRGNSTVTIWDPLSGQVLLSYENSLQVNSISWNPNGPELALGDVDAIRIIDTDTGLLLKSISDDTGTAIVSTAWNPDGTHLATGGIDNKVRIWNVETGQTEQIFEEDTEYILAVAWNSTGKSVASASLDGTIRIWDLQTGSLIATTSNPAVVYAIAWKPDGSNLAYILESGNKVHIIALSSQCHTDGELVLTPPP